ASGKLAALAGVRDVDLVAASSDLDTFAITLIGEVNRIQTNGGAGAVDLDGGSTATVPLFGGTDARTITVLLTGADAGRKIGAALSTDPGDNQNALNLADLRTRTQAALGNATFSGHLADLTGQGGEREAPVHAGRRSARGGGGDARPVGAGGARAVRQRERLRYRGARRRGRRARPGGADPGPGRGDRHAAGLEPPLARRAGRSARGGARAPRGPDHARQHRARRPAHLRRPRPRHLGRAFQGRARRREHVRPRHGVQRLAAGAAREGW